MGYADRKQLWFGTEDYAKWIATPLRGSNVDPSGWNTGGALLNGGGYHFGSTMQHREYSLEWGDSSSYEAAQEMLDFANGAYGDGLIHFVLPTIYDKNILPPEWASPSITAGTTSLVRGVSPLRAGAHPPQLGLNWPLGASMNLSDTPTGYREGDSLFIPVPEGYDLLLGHLGASYNGAGVFASVFNYTGQMQSTTRLTDIVQEAGDLGVPGSEMPTVADLIPNPRASSPSNQAGVHLWFGVQNPTGSARTLTSYGLTARLVPSGSVTVPPLGTPFWDYPAIMRKPWVGGMGNSGCRFISKPTMTLQTGFDGGRAGYSATLREVGTWLRR